MIIHEGKALTKTVDIANRFANHFNCIQSSMELSTDNYMLTVYPSTFAFCRIVEENVLDQLTFLDDRKAIVSDKIPAKLLRTVAPGIVASLTTMLST